MKEIISRLLSETPQFFKRIIYIGITIGTFGGSILAAQDQLPVWLVDLADNFIQVGLIAGIVASLAAKNPPKEA